MIYESKSATSQCKLINAKHLDTIQSTIYPIDWSCRITPTVSLAEIPS